MNITIEEVKELMEKRKAEREKRIAQINAILNQEQESEIDALCKIFGFDRNAIETSSKEYPLPEYKTDATNFIYSEEFKVKGKLIRSYLGESLQLPEESTLIVGKNKIGKTPVLKFWKETLDNRIMNIRRQEKINFESGEQFWQLDSELQKVSNLYVTELELYERFDIGEIIDYSNRTGFLFLDDIFQESVWKDTTNFKHERFVTYMTKLYESLRDKYSDKLIVIATTNHLPTVETLDSNTRIQSRVLGTFKNIIKVKEVTELKAAV